MEVSGPGIGGLSWAEVQAILEGRALRVGLGCKGEGGTGPTLIWFLCGVGATAIEAWGAIAASTEPTVGLPWAATMVAAGGLGLEPSAGGGEDYLTLSQKLCPLPVFTMAGLEKKRRWRGGEEGGFHK